MSSAERDKTGLHLVTAWCVEEKLVLAQKAVGENCNDIVALPELLKMLDLKGAVVTVDAMGTQTDIAEQIVKAGLRRAQSSRGDYVMAVKDNHPTLAEAIKRNMDDLILEKFQGVEHAYHESTDAGHGRIDSRQVWATSNIDWLQRRGEWKNLTSVVVVQSTRRMVGTGEVQTSRRYYATSLPADATRLGTLIRNHWSIENGQHFVLDTAFDEDRSRVRTDHGPENLGVFRRIALSLLRRDKSCKVGVKNKRVKAGRNRKYLMKVLLSPAKAK